MATLYQIHDTVPGREVEPRNGTDFKLQELYDLLHVDMIEIVNLMDGTILVIDEEGKLKDMVVRNEAATALFTAAFPGVRDFIAGSALHCRDEEVG